MNTQTLSPTIQLADWTQTLQRSLLRQIVNLTAQPGLLSFAGGLPATDLFPTTQYAQSLAHVLATDPRALQYNPPYTPFKEQLQQLTTQRGLPCTLDEIFITTGAQQALNVIGRLLLNPGGQVMMEEMIYSGFQQVVAPYQPEILTIPTDLKTGIDVDVVEAHLLRGARPAFLYLIPEAHNPLGVSISLEKRLRLVELARRYHMPIIEDDAYGFLAYRSTTSNGNNQPLPPLRALDPDWVLYVGSFSKIMAPALRLGWLVAPQWLVPKLTVVKEAGDLETSGLTQRVVAHYLAQGHLPAHLHHLRQAYQHRRDLMLQALDDYFPPEAEWTKPNAGMFIWVKLPETINTFQHLSKAIEEQKVAYVPGQAFAVPPNNATNCLRLSFSNCPIDQINAGIHRLAQTLL